MKASEKGSWAKGLNQEQLAAVEAPAGPVLVLAGPGSGKTRVLTHRVEYLLEGYGVEPWQVVAVTFTNKAAREMRSRLERQIGARLAELSLGTFHALCARILRREYPSLGRSGSFVIYDGEDQLGVVRKVLEELRLDPKSYSPGAIHAAISRAKSVLVEPQECLRRASSYWEEVVGRVYARYQERLAASNALDFDDLLMATAGLFQDNPGTLARYQERYQHILVDEFQDTNVVQYAILRALSAKARSLFVVGDPDQSIYSWRNADIRNILNFERDFPEAKVYLLERNYRSTQNILDAAHAVISASPQHRPRTLWTDKGGGEPLVLFEAYNGTEEAQFVVLEIERLVAQGTVRPGECAVMYRTNAQSRAFEEAFLRRGMPYRLVGATRFYQRREIKDVVAYLRLLHNPEDELSLARIINIPPRGIGEKTLERALNLARQKGIALYAALEELAEEGSPLASRSRVAVGAFVATLKGLSAQKGELGLVELLDRVLEETGYARFIRDGTEAGEERWANLMELRTVARNYQDLAGEEALARFLEEVALVADVDGLEEVADAPILLTLHSAKGLEFDVVFLVGLEEGLLPHSRSQESAEDLEEERRLCYVGMTRARERLYLLYTYRRMLFGEEVRTQPSRFLDEIPRALFTVGAEREALLQEVWRPQSAPSRTVTEAIPSFRSGDRVQHPLFGEGIVIESKPSGDDEEVAVAFAGMKPKRLLGSLAKMEKLS